MKAEGVGSDTTFSKQFYAPALVAQAREILSSLTAATMEHNDRVGACVMWTDPESGLKQYFVDSVDISAPPLAVDAMKARLLQAARETIQEKYNLP